MELHSLFVFKLLNPLNSTYTCQHHQWCLHRQSVVNIVDVITDVDNFPYVVSKEHHIPLHSLHVTKLLYPLITICWCCQHHQCHLCDQRHQSCQCCTSPMSSTSYKLLTYSTSLTLSTMSTVFLHLSLNTTIIQRLWYNCTVTHLHVPTVTLQWHYNHLTIVLPLTPMSYTILYKNHSTYNHATIIW